MRRVLSRDRLAGLALLWACLLAYGLVIPWLGLYADDWPFVYVAGIAGLRGVVEFISWVRPVAAWVFATQAALIGTNFWAYHLLLLVLRWLAALLLWRVLRRVWPEENSGDPALWAALLFCVYPAFKQAPLALEYGPHFIALILLFLSLWASLRITTDPPASPRALTGLWLLAWAGSFHVFLIEYFTGLEILRPVLVWVVLHRSLGAGQAARRTLRHWLPFLPVLAGFLIWRVFGLGFPSYQPELVDGLASGPLAAVRELAQTILHDLWTTGAAAWAQPFQEIPVGRTGLVWAAVCLLAFASLFSFLALRSPATQPAKPPATRARPLELVGAGLLAMFAAGWPFWITRIPVELNFPWDRPTLSFMVGACLLAAGMVLLLARLPLPRRTLLPALAVALLLAGSIGLHVQNANRFRKEWRVLTDFAWQLSWRIPALPPGTALVLDQTPFHYHVDKFIVPIVNWTYAPESRSLDTPYWLFDFHKLEERGVFAAGPGTPLETAYGTLAFTGQTNQAIFLVYAPPSCLYVLSADRPPYLPLSEAVRTALPASQPGWIAPAGPAAQPPAFLGPEPARGWCYSFAQVELALQSGDADRAAALADSALAAGLTPANAAEYLPLIEAYARAARWEDARRLTPLAAANDFTRRAACATWERLAAQASAQEAAPALRDLGCAQ